MPREGCVSLWHSLGVFTYIFASYVYLFLFAIILSLLSVVILDRYKDRNILNNIERFINDVV